MTARYNIVQGDRTTTGGFVVGASLSAFNENRQLAGEGDLCTCPACKSTGRICCVGDRIPGIFDGVQEALSGDIVLCKCTIKPRLLNSMYSMVQFPESTAAAVESAVIPFASPDWDNHFQVVHATTGKPLEHIAWFADHAGQPISGTTSDTGMTDLFKAAQADPVALTHLVQTRIGVR